MYRLTVKTPGAEIIVEAESDNVEKRHNIIMEVALLRSRILGYVTLQELADALYNIRKK